LSRETIESTPLISLIRSEREDTDIDFRYEVSEVLRGGLSMPKWGTEGPQLYLCKYSVLDGSKNIQASTLNIPVCHLAALYAEIGDILDEHPALRE
jgi:hypothetical protein